MAARAVRSRSTCSRSSTRRLRTRWKMRRTRSAPGLFGAGAVAHSALEVIGEDQPQARKALARQERVPSAQQGLYHVSVDTPLFSNAASRFCEIFTRLQKVQMAKMSHRREHSSLRSSRSRSRCTMRRRTTRSSRRSTMPPTRCAPQSRIHGSSASSRSAVARCGWASVGLVTFTHGSKPLSLKFRSMESCE